VEQSHEGIRHERSPKGPQPQPACGDYAVGRDSGANRLTLSRHGVRACRLTNPCSRPPPACGCC
jgi:hypothetical protein